MGKAWRMLSGDFTKRLGRIQKAKLGRLQLANPSAIIVASTDIMPTNIATNVKSMDIMPKIIAPDVANWDMNPTRFTASNVVNMAIIHLIAQTDFLDSADCSTSKKRYYWNELVLGIYY